MSILIKGMEMPKNCFMCYLSRLNGERLFCNVTGEEVLRYKIAPECPMTETTEQKHGKWEDVEVIDISGRTDLPLSSISSMRCSVCNRYHNEVYYYGIPTEMAHFCSFCGAEMESEDGN